MNETKTKNNNKINEKEMVKEELHNPEEQLKERVQEGEAKVIFLSI